MIKLLKVQFPVGPDFDICNNCNKQVLIHILENFTQATKRTMLKLGKQSWDIDAVRQKLLCKEHRHAKAPKLDCLGDAIRNVARI